MKKDYVIFGGISGAAGGIVAFLLGGLPAKLLGLTDRTIFDYARVIVLYNPQNEILDYAVGILAHISNSAILGVILSGIIYFTSSRYLLIKGFVLGTSAWLVFMVTGTLFRVPQFTTIPANVALVTYFTSAFWGVTSAYLLAVLNARYAEEQVENNKINIKKLVKFGATPSPALRRLPKKLRR